MFDGLTESEVKLVNTAILWGLGVARGIMYFLVALTLISMNTYGVDHAFFLAFVIGLLGVGSATTRVSLIAIVALLAMVILPVPAVEMIRHAIS
ncbi:hypothetical protein K9B32_22835 [Rhizobium sp. 3T7]|uniref:hypothetical protein n=1 Tax=Rhizobium sp. 3T7 TaxID=2874922 RepID=UPI001CC93E30|nr:hypothetical protein [Rhizobium sp. 3T7]MBZ9792909.1 hypothetical protein [Rhizobium sp. 3T7]